MILCLSLSWWTLGNTEGWKVTENKLQPVEISCRIGCATSKVVSSIVFACCTRCLQLFGLFFDICRCNVDLIPLTHFKPSLGTPLFFIEMFELFLVYPPWGHLATNSSQAAATDHWICDLDPRFVYHKERHSWKRNFKCIRLIIIFSSNIGLDS